MPLLISALLLACAPPDYTPPVADEDPVYPTIKILFPNPGLADMATDELLVCPMFNVVVDVENFTLSHENYDGDPVEGEGHWHLYVDDATLSQAQAAVADPYASPAAALEPGFHTLYAQLVQNNHLPLPDSQVDQDLPQNVHAVEIMVSDDMMNCVGGGNGGGGYGGDTGGDSGDSGNDSGR